jgi:hypothetical protein
MPVVVLTSDRQLEFGAGGVGTWPAWRAAQDRLASLLNARHITRTNSSHAIQMQSADLNVSNATKQFGE